MNKQKQIYNPFLPLTEYIPDGEPHVFGDRVYCLAVMTEQVETTIA